MTWCKAPRKCEDDASEKRFVCFNELTMVSEILEYALGVAVYHYFQILEMTRVVGNIKSGNGGLIKLRRERITSEYFVRFRRRVRN